MKYKYERLQRLVDGKHVYLLGHGVSNYKVPDDAITVRFNASTEECDIWVTVLHMPEGADRTTEDLIMCHTNTPLIVGSVPNQNLKIDLPNNTEAYEDFGDRYLKVNKNIDLECIDLSHWLTLAVAMPYWPLSGMVFLSMLQHTNFKSCTAVGFNFYTKSDHLGRCKHTEDGHLDMLRLAPLLKLKGSIRGRHDMLAAINWTKKLLSHDRRYVWDGVDLNNAERAWKKRLIVGNRHFQLSL